MLVKTKAIVLRTYKYSETSIIAKLYTQEYGLLSFMVHGVRKKKSKSPASFFQALQIVQLEAELKEKSKLHHIKEISLATGLHHIHSNMAKSSIALFLSEVLFKTIREEESNANMFDFIENSIAFLEEAEEKSAANFHLVFLLSFSRYLGFYPKNNYDSANTVFNLGTGEFESANRMINLSENLYIIDEMGLAIHELLTVNYSNMSDIKLASKSRRLLLGEIIRFYQIHLPEMGDIQSLEVLETVFS